jgi:hypothetical protein
MDRMAKYQRWLILAAYLFSGFFLCFMVSCGDELDKDVDPAAEWDDRFDELILNDGDSDVPVEDPLYVFLDVPIDESTVNWSSVQLFSANPSPVPGAILFFYHEGPNGEPYGIIFQPICELVPQTDYQLFIRGVRTTAGERVDDMVINFRTGDLPGDLTDPWFCDTFATAFDLEDLSGINGGMSEIGPSAQLVANGIQVYPIPTYPMINNPDYIFGDRMIGGTYFKRAYQLNTPPYLLLVQIQPLFSDVDLSTVPEVDRWFNLRRYIMGQIIDRLDGDSDWTSDDPTNTPASFEMGQDALDKIGCMKVGLVSAASEGDEVSRTFAPGEYASLNGLTGIQFSARLSTLTTLASDSVTFAMRLSDPEGDVIETTKKLKPADQLWSFNTCLVSDFSVVDFVDGFDGSRISKISFLIQINNLNGDLYLDFINAGSIENLPVYLPEWYVTMSESLPLYVGPDGSTYWAYEYETGYPPPWPSLIHTVIPGECTFECPIMSPEEALVDDYLAQPAP